MIIRITQFEIVIRSVHTRSQISVLHSRAEEDPWLVSGYPANQTCCTELAFTVLLCIYAARGIKAEVIRRSRTCTCTCSSAPKSQFRGQGIHTVILLRDLRDASLKNTSRPPFELHNSNYALRCNFAYTRSKIPSFE